MNTKQTTIAGHLVTHPVTTLVLNVFKTKKMAHTYGMNLRAHGVQCFSMPSDDAAKHADITGIPSGWHVIYK